MPAMGARNVIGQATVVLFASLAAACFAANGASQEAIPLVRMRAESDLACPAEEIRIEQGLGGEYKAVGCGHKATYQTACEGLHCEVRGEGEKPLGWRDRPDPNSPIDATP